MLAITKYEPSGWCADTESYEDDGGSSAHNKPQLTLVSVKARNRKPDWWEGEYTDDYARPKNALCVDSAKRGEA